jgi:hypothetical protein
VCLPESASEANGTGPFGHDHAATAHAFHQATGGIGSAERNAAEASKAEDYEMMSATLRFDYADTLS